jgi:hypothetical protein
MVNQTHMAIDTRAAIEEALRNAGIPIDVGEASEDKRPWQL